ncbi:Arabinan endo-1,5-alpha-L-arabinosidase B [Aspergillus cavernicola]|uniref:Arabinan endo-1,5-alpha-L-arabinosidase B n=1 Tax=Aspergillus cavernicola TaxID=176166 RepID=A0ABR4HZF5_9EURO
MNAFSLQDMDERLLPWHRPHWSGGDIDSNSSRPRSTIGKGIRPSALRRYIKMAVLLVVFFFISLAVSAAISPRSNSTSNNGTQSEDTPPATVFPPTHGTDFLIHDPSIILVGKTFYSYSVGPHIAINQAPSLDGPWTELGTVLDADSMISKGDRTAPWAPNTLQIGTTFYCYYSVSNAGSRDSAIGVATSDKPGPGGWTDHGPILQSGTGNGSDVYPLNESNTIDPSVLFDTDGSAYLSFGSFWSGIWQVRLEQDLVSIDEDPAVFDAQHLAANTESRRGQPIEGGFISYHTPYYYLWYSWGTCCEFKDPASRTSGKEYRIRVGRSNSARGPFVDRQGKDMVDGGGDTVYGSNADTFAPGGQGVLTDAESDVLYYHYLNTSISYEFGQARLGYNRLDYVDGWPLAV